MYQNINTYTHCGHTQTLEAQVLPQAFEQGHERVSIKLRDGYGEETALHLNADQTEALERFFLERAEKRQKALAEREARAAHDAWHSDRQRGPDDEDDEEYGEPLDGERA